MARHINAVVSSLTDTKNTHTQSSDLFRQGRISRHLFPATRNHVHVVTHTAGALNPRVLNATTASEHVHVRVQVKATIGALLTAQYSKLSLVVTQAILCIRQRFF